MKLGYFVLEGHQIKEVDNVLAWGRWFEKADRRVEQTKRGRILVSTVFLGLDHNFASTGEPVLFETMIFGGRQDNYQMRWHTWEEAEAGHKTTVKMALGGWRSLVEPIIAEGLYWWSSIPQLPVQESWADTLKWLIGRK